MFFILPDSFNLTKTLPVSRIKLKFKLISIAKALPIPGCHRRNRKKKINIYLTYISRYIASE